MVHNSSFKLGKGFLDFSHLPWGSSIGLRERMWIACDSGLPCFPFDFPDCKAYSLLMAEEASSYNSWAELWPPAVRPSRVPIPPPWHCLESTCNKRLEIDHDIDGSYLQLYGLSSSELPDMLFKGFIPRFSSALREDIQNCTDNPSQRRLCVVWVLVRAYKEGAFEDRAIISAFHSYRPSELGIQFRRRQTPNPPVPYKIIFYATRFRKMGATASSELFKFRVIPMACRLCHDWLCSWK